MQNLNDNTAALQAILAAVNALPEAGNGGSGGLPSGISALATDTLTPASDLTANQKITHGLGVTPNLFIVLATGRIDGPAMTGSMLYQITSGQTWHFDTIAMTPISSLRHLDSSGYMGASSADNQGAMTQTECTILSNSARKLRAGVTYRWVAAVVDGIE